MCPIILLFAPNCLYSKISLSLPQAFSAIGLIASIAGFNFIFNILNICFLNVLAHIHLPRRSFATVLDVLATSD